MKLNARKLLAPALAAAAAAGAWAPAGAISPAASPALRAAGTTALTWQVQYSPVVRDVQQALNQLGYDAGPVDGLFGSTTRNAIRAYQRDQGLSSDGQASANLLQHIRENGRGGARDDRREEAVERTQQRLADLGYDVTASGELDWQTRNAIRAYQRDNNLEATGELDRDLVRHIRENAGDGRGRNAVAENPAGLSTAAVADIESGLRLRGYDVGPVDGRIDGQTTAAIRAYQRDRGVTADGAASQELLTMLQEGVGEPMNTPENIQAVQRKLNDLGYNAGPADGVMGPSTRTAIQAYRQQNNLGSSMDINANLLTSLGVAGAAASAGTGSTASTQRYAVQMSDDFEDGNYTANPAWVVRAGEFQVANGYLTVSLPPAAGGNAGQLFAGILNQALGGGNVAAIAQPTNLANGFKIDAEILGSSDGVVQMHLGPYRGNDVGSGYRLVFDQNAGDRLAIVARQGDQQKVVAERSGISALGDGRRHKLVWTRNPDGLMTVSIDGEFALQGRDTTFTGTFDGFSFVNVAGTWNLHSVSAASVVD